MCISDTHNRQREPSSTYKHADLHDLPDGDVLIHTGDFTNKGTPQEITDFATWISKQSKYKHCIVIAGNHDIGLAPSGDLNENKSCVPVDDPEAVRKAKETLMQSCTYLEDSAVNLYGYKVYGSPYSPEFGHGWAFNGVRGEHLKSIWDKIPDNTDVLLTHGPPLGVLDVCWRQDRAGCEDLLRTVVGRVKPKYHVFGHIHKQHGVVSNGETTFVNAATCNWGDLHPPIIFDLPAIKED